MEFFIPLLNGFGLALVLLLMLAGIFVAPWPVLLMLLIAVLVVSQRMMQQTLHPAMPSSGSKISPPAQNSHQGHTPADGTPEGDRSLHFRGATYTPNSTPQHGQLSGKYRGRAWQSPKS